MSGAFLRMAIVMIAVVAAFTITPAATEARIDNICSQVGIGCHENCVGLSGPALSQCLVTCDRIYKSCKGEPSRGSTSADKQVDTGTKQPTGKGMVDTAPTSGDKQVGGGTKVKDRFRQHTDALGGAQQLQQSGGTSGTSTIQRSRSGKKH